MRILQALILFFVLPLLVNGQKSARQLKGRYVSEWGATWILEFKGNTFREETRGCGGSHFGMGTYVIKEDSIILQYERHKADTAYYFTKFSRDDTLKGSKFIFRFHDTDTFKEMGSKVYVYDFRYQKMCEGKLQRNGIFELVLDKIPPAFYVNSNCGSSGIYKEDIPAGCNVGVVDEYPVPDILSRWHYPTVKRYRFNVSQDSIFCSTFQPTGQGFTFGFHRVRRSETYKEQRIKDRKMWRRIIAGTWKLMEY